MEAKFIESAKTVGTGGNCMADLLQLKDGPLVVLTDECLAVYDNPNDFLNEDGEGVVENYRGLDDGFTRDGHSAVGLTFVERIGTYEPDGPVSVDLIVLCDGRVIGIDSESAVLYPSMEAFDAITETGEMGDFPAVPLT